MTLRRHDLPEGLPGQSAEEVVDKERERLDTLRERVGRIGELLGVLG